MKDLIELKKDDIKSKIHTIRGIQVMLDNDLANLYGVLTGRFNEQIKRNLDRFPENFMFQLTKEEAILISQNAISSWGGKRKFPYVFTEQGIASLSGVLKSKKAVEINIQIIRTFVSMRKFISKNAEIFIKLDNIERKQSEYQSKTDKKINIIFDTIENKDITPKQGIFFDGQVFDAYKFIIDIIKTSKKSIILIDNYIDESVLTLFSKKNKNVNIIIYTENINSKLKLDIEKFNKQYKSLNVIKFTKAHDRFLIIDNKDIYHFGASLKDLGKKWFAFSKFDKKYLEILSKLKEKE